MDNIVLVIPCFNDWQSLEKLVQECLLSLQNQNLKILIINDGSDLKATIPSNEHVEIVDLNRNVGHQRAIAIGLCYVYENIPDIDVCVVMDSDGEDNPEHIPSLLEKASNTGNICFAKRHKRHETPLFRILYQVYKVLFKILVGREINFGNFSAIPAAKLKTIVSNPDLWNHYSGSVIKTKLSIERIECNRGKRYFGSSKMNYVSLILHGLSSISVHLEMVSVRILLVSFVSLIALGIATLLIVIIRLFTDFLVPGWASTIFILMAILGICIFGISMILCLSILISRNTFRPAPLTFYKNFIKKPTA